MGKEILPLTTRLYERQDEILVSWEEKMREREKGSTQLATMSRKEFQNGIPDFLERLIDSLRGKGKSFADIGEGHGAQRWYHGVDLSMMINEWVTLHEVLQNEITSFLKESGLDSHSLDKAHQILATHIQEGIKFSIIKFNQLQQEKYDAQRRHLEQALEKPEDLSRKNDLRSASHDLQGMMYGLQIGFQLLKEENLSPKVSELIDQMTKGADSLEQLLNDLLDLFRLETKREEINLSHFDAAEVLTELCESMQPMTKTEKKLELKCEVAESVPVKNDQKKIERIARNLLLNALKYTNEGYVKARCEKISDKHWLLEISDTGPGLDAAHAESLTIDDESSIADEQNDYASDENTASPPVQSHGEGIGLLIVRHLCRLLDATIQVDTRPGEGTTFKIVLPLDLSE